VLLIFSLKPSTTLVQPTSYSILSNFQFWQLEAFLCFGFMCKHWIEPVLYGFKCQVIRSLGSNQLSISVMCFSGMVWKL